MEEQTTLFNQREHKTIIELEKNKLSLEHEKENFIENLCEFIQPLDFKQLQITGRPKTDFKDIIKCLCIMSYNGMSYRRTQPDLRTMYEKKLISHIPSGTTLNECANDENTKLIIERLVQLFSLFFIDNEDTTILDSTWFAKRMYGGGYKQVHDKRACSLNKVRKIHVAIMKNTKVIAYAKATQGTEHDCPHFEDMVRTICKNGFQIKTLLADAGYNSKKNYALCKELGIMNVFIDFKSNNEIRRAKSDLWREKLRLYKEHKDIWNQSYRFRVIVEGVFSAMKRKNITYLRSKKETAQDVEVLLKVLVYNLTIIGKYS